MRCPVRPRATYGLTMRLDLATTSNARGGVLGCSHSMCAIGGAALAGLWAFRLERRRAVRDELERASACFHQPVIGLLTEARRVYGAMVDPHCADPRLKTISQSSIDLALTEVECNSPAPTAEAARSEHEDLIAIGMQLDNEPPPRIARSGRSRGTGHKGRARRNVDSISIDLRAVELINRPRISTAQVRSTVCKIDRACSA